MMKKFLGGLLTTLLHVHVHVHVVVVVNAGLDDPVLAGYDLVAYHSLQPQQDGVPGSAAFQTRYNGYLYYFVDQHNLDTFVADPEAYLPAYGGFCAWGVAWEYETDGWPWAADHMGPPCGPADGWALLTTTDSSSNTPPRLYCSIWRSYQDDFNQRQAEGIQLANQRWIEWYGSLEAGPKNNGCYAWNWQSCFAESIINDNNNNPILEEEQTTTILTLPTTASPTPAQTTTTTQTTIISILEPGQTTTNSVVAWSDPMTVLGGAVTFQWTLADVDSIRPLLIVDLMMTMMDVMLDDDESESPLIGNNNHYYLAFGVAEQVMQGALVVCSPIIISSSSEEDDAVAESAAVTTSTTTSTCSSTCKTFLGAGMGITEPTNDAVQPICLESHRNETHYHVRFSANLFACWSNPTWPARILFSRGLVSGNGDPMPHYNNPLHRQAVAGVELLSVIIKDNDGFPSNITTSNADLAPEPLALEPLPGSTTIVEVDGTTDSFEILQGRVTVEYGLYYYYSQPQDLEVIHVHLNNVRFNPQEEEDDEHIYVGFGFATDTMSGLIITCAPSAEFEATTDGSIVLQELTATCHQWRGFGTNLYPRALETDAGGWFLASLEGNGTHVNYTLAGRSSDVLEETVAGRITPDTNLRAIFALGRAAPDTATPLMHTSTDRTPMVLDKLAAVTQGFTVNSLLQTAPEGLSVSTSGAPSMPKVAAFTVLVGATLTYMMAAA
jgi:YHS domain-containing protein